MSESTHDLTLSRIGGESSPFMRELINFTRELALIDKDIVALDKPSCLDDGLLTRLSEAVQASIEVCRQFESQYGEDKELLRSAQLMFLQETNPLYETYSNLLK
jgi:hypothetical protein